MQTVKIVYWEEDGGWLGYLQDYLDYWTQEETLDDLKDHLKDLYPQMSVASVKISVSPAKCRMIWSSHDAR